MFDPGGEDEDWEEGQSLKASFEVDATLVNVRRPRALVSCSPTQLSYAATGRGALSPTTSTASPGYLVPLSCSTIMSKTPPLPAETGVWSDQALVQEPWNASRVQALAPNEGGSWGGRRRSGGGPEFTVSPSPSVSFCPTPPAMVEASLYASPIREKVCSHRPLFFGTSYSDRLWTFTLSVQTD